MNSRARTAEHYWFECQKKVWLFVISFCNPPPSTKFIICGVQSQSKWIKIIPLRPQTNLPNNFWLPNPSILCDCNVTVMWQEQSSLNKARQDIGLFLSFVCPWLFPSTLISHAKFIEEIFSLKLISKIWILLCHVYISKSVSRFKKGDIHFCHQRLQSWNQLAE